MPIQMQIPGGAGTFTLPSPGGTYTPVNGVASVQAEDVDMAIRQGWQVMAGEPWPANRLVRMKVPTVGAWSSSGAVTFPDGATAAIAAGIAKIPQIWVTWAVGFGWAFS